LAKIAVIICQFGPNFFIAWSKIKLFNVVEIYGSKKGKTKILSLPSFLLLLDLGSGNGKKSLSGSRDNNPVSATGQNLPSLYDCIFVVNLFGG
jgi:hypothetical protein